MPGSGNSKQRANVSQKLYRNAGTKSRDDAFWAEKKRKELKPSSLKKIAGGGSWSPGEGRGGIG